MTSELWYAVVGGCALAVAAVSHRALDGAPRAPRSPAPTESRIRDLDIEFYQARVARDPRSARDFTQLAGLYLQRARETADNADLVRAEQNARHSLALRTRPERRGRSACSHRACWRSTGSPRRSRSRRLLAAADSTSVAARGLVGGDRHRAGPVRRGGPAVRHAGHVPGDLGIAPRLARWAELHGPARGGATAAAAGDGRGGRRHGMPREQLAWFHLRLGDLALRSGHLGEAEHELEAGLAILPGDYRLLGAWPGSRPSRHQWRRAAEAGELAVSRALDPATLGLLSDAWGALGDTAKADEYYRAMALSVLQPAGRLPPGLEPLPARPRPRRARACWTNVGSELETRRDIYGYDLLAWALHRSGRDAEARAPMAQALALGTQDAMLHYHAGMIELAPATRRRPDPSSSARWRSIPRGIRPSPPRRGPCSTPSPGRRRPCPSCSPSSTWASATSPIRKPWTTSCSCSPSRPSIAGATGATRSGWSPRSPSGTRSPWRWR